MDSKKILLNQVQNTIKMYDMLHPGDTVLCAVSGGADSVALLQALVEIQQCLQISVCACHVHHGIRGEEADRDAEFAQSLFSRHELSFRMVYRDVPKEAQMRGKGLEETARILRYEALRTAADELHATKIATAHTLDDNLETMIFHLVRGAGTKGLGGIPPTRECFIRPLIDSSRQLIEEYLEQIQQTYVTDSTNFSVDYTRNCIRQQVIPVLRKINPKCAQAAGRAARHLRQDESFLKEKLMQIYPQICVKNNGALQVDAITFCKQFPAIQGRIAQKALKQAGICAENRSDALIERFKSFLHNQQAVRLDLVDGICAERCQKMVYLLRLKEKKNMSPIAVQPGWDQVIPDTNVRVRLKICRDMQDFNKKFNTFYAKYDTIHFETLVIRTWKKDDRIQLTERSGHATLKKRFQERGIPRYRRNRLLVLADQNGIIAVQDLGVDFSRWVVDNKKMLKIEFEGE